MADRNIDCGKAVAWLKEVNEEIDSVKRVLEEVPNVTCDVPGGDDTFIKMLEATNSFTTDAWNKVTKEFTSAWEKVDGVLEELVRVGQVAADIFDGYDRTAKR